MPESAYHEAMAHIALSALPVFGRPIDLFAVNAVIQDQLVSAQVAKGIDDRISVRHFMALHKAVVVEHLQPAQDFTPRALGALSRFWTGSSGFLCLNQLLERFLLILREHHGRSQVLEHVSRDEPILED